MTKPDKPIDFIIEKLGSEKNGKSIFDKWYIFIWIVRKIFLMGPPGCQKAENAKGLADSFGWKYISPG